jgi:hypothetical protein
MEELEVQPVIEQEKLDEKENQFPDVLPARIFTDSVKITCGGKLKALFLKPKDNLAPIPESHYKPVLNVFDNDKPTKLYWRPTKDNGRPMVKQNRVGGDLTLGFLPPRSSREDYFRANNRDQLFFALPLVPLVNDLEAAMREHLPAYYAFHTYQASKLVRPPDEVLVKKPWKVGDAFQRAQLEKLEKSGWAHFHGSKAFSTLTLNKNILFGMHGDGHNMPHTLSCLTALGDFGGGYLCFPRLGIGFDVHPYDVLISDTNYEYHCSGSIVVGKRYTIVAYLHGRLDRGWRMRIDEKSGRVIGLKHDKSLIGSIDSWLEQVQKGGWLWEEAINRQGSGPAKKEKLTRQPRVWDCHKGKKYPADAVYVGCRALSRKGEILREGTIFGNGTHPLVSHKGAIHSEREFRAYAIEKLKDPAFRAEAEKLRGRDLLCWCVQEGKRRAEFCHARVWLELINNSQGELPSVELSTKPRRDFDWGYYEPNFLSKGEADALFEMATAQPRVRPIIKRSGYQLRRCASSCWSVRDRNDDDSDLMIPLEEAPPEIITLQRKLSDLAGKEVNYFSLQAYENERDHIGWHQHREDKCRDARVFIISLGERRSFGVDKLCPKCLLCDACNQRKCHPDGPPCSNYAKCQAAKKHRATCAVRKSTKTIILPRHGSLIALSSEANNWYEHAILDDKEPKGLRISINTKCIPPEDAAAGYVPREFRVAGGFAQNKSS